MHVIAVDAGNLWIRNHYVWKVAQCLDPMSQPDGNERKREVGRGEESIGGKRWAPMACEICEQLS